MMFTFTSKTHFLLLRNTAYHCRLLQNYDSEWKKLTRINFLRCNTLELTRKKFSFFNTFSTWNMIQRPFFRETSTWFRFSWTSRTLTTSQIIKTTRSLWCLHLLVNAFSFAEKHCISLSFTTKLWLRMKKANKHKLLTLQHTRKDKKKNSFSTNFPPEILYSGLS
jgi:hypothetical protein